MALPKHAGEGNSSVDLGSLIMGGAGFSYQLTSTPEDVPVTDIVARAFELGVRTIDTSPYYDPSEQLIGAALSSHQVSSKYRREDYRLMTKVGRIAADKFDYSPAWVRQSVERSLARFNTSYLDVVFCHDVEYVSIDEAVGAVGALFELVQKGAIRYVGISGYDLDALKKVAFAVLEKHKRPVDVIQNWAQLTLQNTRLEQHGLAVFREAGVRAVCSSSPLAVGLLRSSGVPIGSLGDWHPAPAGLRAQAKKAADWVEIQGDNLSALALRFAIRRALINSSSDMSVATITGIGSFSDLEENVITARAFLGPDLSLSHGVSTEGKDGVSSSDAEFSAKDEEQYQKVREILGDWVDYDFSKPASK